MVTRLKSWPADPPTSRPKNVTSRSALSGSVAMTSSVTGRVTSIAPSVGAITTGASGASPTPRGAPATQVAPPTRGPRTPRDPGRPPAQGPVDASDRTGRGCAGALVQAPAADEARPRADLGVHGALDLGPRPRDVPDASLVDDSAERAVGRVARVEG